MPSYRISRVIVPATSYALVTIDQAKQSLKIPLDDTSQDAAVQAQVDHVSAAVARYCDRVFVVQTYRDQLRSVCSWLRYGEPLPTAQKPIAEAEGEPLITITQDGAELEATVYEVDAERGLLYRLDSAGASAAWTGSTAILDYTAGYDPIPDDVQAATLEWITARWSAQGKDPALRSETIPDVISQMWSSDAQTPSMPSGARELLAPYRVLSI
jgi:hypothetical protein